MRLGKFSSPAGTRSTSRGLYGTVKRYIGKEKLQSKTLLKKDTVGNRRDIDACIEDEPVFFLKFDFCKLLFKFYTHS